MLLNGTGQRRRLQRRRKLMPEPRRISRRTLEGRSTSVPEHHVPDRRDGDAQKVTIPRITDVRTPAISGSS